MSQAEKPELTRVAPTHDFAGKLRQPSLSPVVTAYVQWQREARKAKEQGTALPPPPEHAPISINLDLTTACNYRCDHCIDWDILNGQIRYEHEELMSSLSAMADRGLKSVILIGGGDPTIYRPIRQVVELLKSRGIQVSIVTNGSRTHVLMAVIELLDEKDWIRMSIDSGTNKTFIDMHHPARAVTLESICESVPVLREKNPKPLIGFSFVITWNGAEREDGNKVIENIDEIVLATKIARDHNFSYISIKPFLTRSEDGSEVMDPEAAKDDLERIVAKIRKSVDEAKTYETDDFKVTESINLQVLEQGNWRDFTQQPKICHMQSFRQVLSPLGLYNCPAHRGVDKALIGGKNAYNGDEACQGTASDTAKILENFDASKECAGVTCLYNKVNWWLEDAIEGKIGLEELQSEIERRDWFL